MAPSAPRYMTRFRCLADTCEDTCCAGLVVRMSEARWRRLRDTVAGGPDAVRVEAFVRPDPSGEEAAYVAKREDGHCAFLDAARLCSLHRQYGESVLPDACATFPRAATRWGERLEVAGSLACPEVARLCLLAEDGVDVVPVSEDTAVRPEVARRMGGNAEDAWTRHAGAVRATAIGLLQRRELPFASRLFLLGQLALRLDGFYFRGTEAFRTGGLQSAESPDALAGDEDVDALLSVESPNAPPGDRGTEALLAGVLRSFTAPDSLSAMPGDFSALALPGGPWAAICTTVLRARMGSVRSERFISLARAVLESYGGASASPDAAWQAHEERRARLEPVFSARVEQYFRHHAVNHWLRHPLTDAPTVLDYVFRLTLRAAVLRWTLLGHPAVVSLCERGASDDARARLDAAAVECFQLIAKHVEQAPELHALANGLAGGGGAETLGRMLVLLKGL